MSNEIDVFLNELQRYLESFQGKVMTRSLGETSHLILSVSNSSDTKRAQVGCFHRKEATDRWDYWELELRAAWVQEEAKAVSGDRAITLEDEKGRDFQKMIAEGLFSALERSQVDSEMTGKHLELRTKYKNLDDSICKMELKQLQPGLDGDYVEAVMRHLQPAQAQEAGPVGAAKEGTQAAPSRSKGRGRGRGPMGRKRGRTH
ncbi:unnamed protein product [Chrysoparadoxa australica]